MNFKRGCLYFFIVIGITVMIGVVIILGAGSGSLLRTVNTVGPLLAVAAGAVGLFMRD